MDEKKHFVALDGLRGVAALAVVCLHATSPFNVNPFPHAALAVDFFFALSGFVIAYAYEKKLQDGMSLLDFAGRRIIRLHPMVLVGLGLGLILYGAKFVLAGGSLMSVAIAAIAGAFLVPTGALAPANPSSHPLNPPSWSLFAEYLANLFYALVARHLTDRKLIALLCLAGAAEVALAAGHGGVGGGDSFSDWYLGPVRVLFPFFSGVGLYRLWQAGLTSRLKVPFAMLAVAIVAVFAVPKGAPIDLVAVLVLFPMAIAAGTHDIRSPAVNAAAKFAGRLSYPVYIVHYPLVWVFSAAVRSLGLSGPKLIALIVVEVLSMVALATAAMLVFDEPVRKFADRRWRLFIAERSAQTMKVSET